MRLFSTWQFPRGCNKRRESSLRELVLAIIVWMIALIFVSAQNSAPVEAQQTAIERGRQVYNSEGCSQCHSGKTGKGPDLSQVGARRSALWLKMHLYDPREVSGSSIMPSYATLFHSKRGNDLVAYLANLRGAASSHRKADEKPWQLSAEAISAAKPADGQQLYNRYCATCHNANGRTRLKWQSEFIESPAILRAGAIQAGAGLIDHLAQIIKFGIPDSDMAGHERLSDNDIASLVAWLTQKTRQLSREQQAINY